eukprot:CAMPEP_0204826358 /NCGR_PEP_ID=MMETSP1346-20131115/4062_1 /ASSEMBLY_ACC=CAM_ASM_000771 /TAXON_ID=215587 /ORGANISM="Aplanochytrium stocchinoi, Strain GSBS06" /LENGTH=390 /DNA_ID=CAMNT_0051954343 /DNA_START=95 /DNA_END=1270 /DNA_ORIENTATION=+
MGCTQSQAARESKQSENKNKIKELKSDKTTKVQAPPTSNNDDDKDFAKKTEAKDFTSTETKKTILEEKCSDSENKTEENVEIVDESIPVEVEEKVATTTTIQTGTRKEDVDGDGDGDAGTTPEVEGEATIESQGGNLDIENTGQVFLEGNEKIVSEAATKTEKETEVVYKPVKKKGSYFRKMFSSPKKENSKENEKQEESKKDGKTGNSSEEASGLAPAAKEKANKKDDSSTASDMAEENEMKEKDPDPVLIEKQDDLSEPKESNQPAESAELDIEEKPVLVDGKESVKNIISKFNQGDAMQTTPSEKAKCKTAPALAELGRSPSVKERQQAIMNSYKEATSNDLKSSLQNRRIQSMKEETRERRSSSEMKDYWHTVEEINEVVVTRKAF